jgi:hypothetical protein
MPVASRRCHTADPSPRGHSRGRQKTKRSGALDRCVLATGERGMAGAAEGARAARTSGGQTGALGRVVTTFPQVSACRSDGVAAVCKPPHFERDSSLM